MVDTKRYAVAIGVVTVAGIVAFVVGAALLATEYGGVWAGVTVGGLAVAAVGAVGLFALGTVEDERQSQTRF